MKRTVIFLLFTAACALPWTPLWDFILDTCYGPLCLLGVDRWFSACETLVLLNETDADFSHAANPARQKEVERVESLCGANRVSTDWLLWVDDPGGGPTVRIRAKAWSPDTARGLVSGVVERYDAGEGRAPMFTNLQYSQIGIATNINDIAEFPSNRPVKLRQTVP